MNDPSTIERAIQLARTGQFRTIGALKDALRGENMEGVDAHLAGVSIRRQLVGLMESAASKDGD